MENVMNLPVQIILTGQQQAALDLLMRFSNKDTDYGMALLEGHAGTGKTTLVGELIKRLRELRIAVAAPTNKAVRVLKSKVEKAAGISIHANREYDEFLRKRKNHPIEFGSIHSFLGLRMKERDDGSQECHKEGDSILHEFNLVVVDECSMLSQEILQHIVTAKRQALILFVGDPAQLPPVGNSGSVSPVFKHVTLKAALAEVVRQAADNPIIQLSVAIRQHMENNQHIEWQTIAQFLPPSPADACLEPGGEDTILSFAQYEIEHGRDARIIAFTNAAVLKYNWMIHQHLFGITPHPFVEGEAVIVHQQTDAIRDQSNSTVTLITSEECKVEKVETANHPKYPTIPASRVFLRRDNDEIVTVYAADDQDDIKREVNRLFGEWRRLKAESEDLRRQGNLQSSSDRMADAKVYSGQAWALQKAFAPLRHAYAVTAHKSQGSTFDTAIVDLTNLRKIRSAFDYNRALYVAITRPSKYLAIVV